MNLFDNLDAISSIDTTLNADNLIRCPHCKESYYQELYSTRTAVYYPPIYKNGVNINPDRNTTSTYCRCLNCGKDFSYQS